MQVLKCYTAMQFFLRSEVKSHLSILLCTTNRQNINKKNFLHCRTTYIENRLSFHENEASHAGILIVTKVTTFFTAVAQVQPVSFFAFFFLFFIGVQLNLSYKCYDLKNKSVCLTSDAPCTFMHC